MAGHSYERFGGRDIRWNRPVEPRRGAWPLVPGVKVGVLLPVPILDRVVQRQPIFEEVDLYRRAAGQLQVDLVLFSTGGCNLARGTVRGYVWRDGRWVDWEGPL